MNELREKFNKLRSKWNQITLELKAEYKIKVEEHVTTTNNNCKKEKLYAEICEIEQLLIKVVGLEETDNIIAETEDFLQINDPLKSTERECQPTKKSKKN